MGDAYAEFMATAHECGACGCAGGADVEVCEACGLCIEFVDVRGF